MAKHVFFSFHYQDVIDFRANVVRNHWITKPDREAAGFFDSSIWESAKKQGDTALKRLINEGIKNTSATCLLIGSETHMRKWVRYEIFKSLCDGKAIFGVHINGIKDKSGNTKINGPNPFNLMGLRIGSNEGKTAVPVHFAGERWVSSLIYPPYTLNKPMPDYAGKIVTLTDFGKKAYDWVADDGYNNFSSWIPA